MAINSMNDPGFLAQLSAQAAQRTPLANKRAANAAIGAGRSGASSQIPVAMQTNNPYFLNPGSNPALQPQPLALNAGPPAGRAGTMLDIAGPSTQGQRLGGSSAGGYARPQGTGNIGSIGAAGDDVINAGEATYARGVQGGATRALNAGASVADDLVAQAAGAGGRTVNTAGKAAGAMRTAGTASTVATNAPKLAGMFANVTRATLMRGAGVAGLGYMASGMIDSMNVGGENSNVDQGISGGVMGAGLGAGGAIALGLGSGPVGWAALGGAALFAGGKMLFGDNKTSTQKMTEATDKTRSTITELSSLYGLDADATSELLMQYDVTTRLYQDNKDKEGLKNYLTGLSSTLPALMLQQQEQADLEKKEQQRFEGMLATQAQFAPIFEQALGQAQQASAGAMETANEISHRLAVSSPNLSNLVRSGAATSNANANRLFAGYAAQMAMGPQANFQNRELADMQAAVEQQQLLDQYMQSAGG